jgi:hypothetical protein
MLGVVEHVGQRVGVVEVALVERDAEAETGAVAEFDGPDFERLLDDVVRED